MDLKLVKNILKLIEESEVNEVSLEEGDFKIKVKKHSDSAPAAVQYQLPQQAAPAPASAPSAATQQAGAKTDSSGAENADGDVVKSPIVGTYYEAPSPDADPFIKEGDKVSKGQTLCIIEAMKIMNEIEAEFSGTLQKILVKNGQAVEYDQPIFVIKKD
jgi:acetyl-CoA carboxylase biotin carboxyl carrier protein